ncbi:MAG: hypothetical protein A3B34_01150 [Candidatus Sungbacteria bacterium RIFCSPLOWO2_01_FULL_54_21]|uniref:Uncharacterized protein n=1 Tax=Candidatus Sungbacteria bacterium RIFCSPLOWO2_01_FULL_54_21 TaxID=1802279 RepID=A0A1G2L7K7_9BACT|nr:MAG: hypothetical protein A2679_02585 [Candidatus Sungbacteria bacterium RIFCSPHIGHO2_01_FULL_54_26]OHA07540.1 MAG: hypothetical protein A3B34_01150 [Candidatus Sungbacteria bacterium RIFCSPLOWO2_01_FULL_54_21]
MLWLFWIVFATGYAWYGTPFLDLTWNLLRHGIPRVWRDEIAANRWVRIVMRGLFLAALLWVVGLLYGFALSRGSDAAVGQTVMFITTVLSAWIALLGRHLGGIAMGALIAISPLPQRTKQRLTRIRKGIGAYVMLGISFQLFITLAFMLVGVYTQAWVVGVFLFVLLGYLVTSKAYNLPITWLPGLKINTQVGLMFGILGVIGLCLIPATRAYILAPIGLSAGNFVNKSVVDTTALDEANKARKATRRQICDVQIGALKKALQDIQPTIEIDDASGKKRKVPNPKALEDHERYSRDLAAKEKVCL